MDRLVKIFAKYFLRQSHVYPQSLVLLGEIKWFVRWVYDINYTVEFWHLLNIHDWALSQGILITIQLVSLLTGRMKLNRLVTMIAAGYYVFLATLIVIDGQAGWLAFPGIILFIMNFTLYLNLVYD